MALLTDVPILPYSDAFDAVIVLVVFMFWLDTSLYEVLQCALILSDLLYIHFNVKLYKSYNNIISPSIFRSVFCQSEEVISSYS